MKLAGMLECFMLWGPQVSNDRPELLSDGAHPKTTPKSPAHKWKCPLRTKPTDDSAPSPDNVIVVDDNSLEEEMTQRMAEDLSSPPKKCKNTGEVADNDIPSATSLPRDLGSPKLLMSPPMEPIPKPQPSPPYQSQVCQDHLFDNPGS